MIQAYEKNKMENNMNEYKHANKMKKEKKKKLASPLNVSWN